MTKDNQRIFIVTYDYPPSNGGIARLCFELKRNLEKQNRKVTIITRKNEGRDADNDLNVIRLSDKRGVLEFKTLLYLRSHVTAHDIIITGNYHPEGMVALLSGRKTYILAHGAEYLEGNNFFRKQIWPIYRRIILNKAACVIANSHYTEKLVKLCAPKAKTCAVPLAVDIDKFHPTCSKWDDGRLHLCSISRLEKFKAQDFVIESIAALPTSYKHSIRLHIGGKGSYKEELEQMVISLGLNEIVSFEGFISDDQLCDFYSQAHVFILCTREEPANRNVEGFGLVFTEAQACATAVIGTRTGGIPDAVEENNGGWLIKQDSKEELLSLLVKLVDDRSLAIREGEKGRKRMEAEMTWARYTAQICNIV